MNIKSKNGSITISGTDVKVGNDLDLSAKKDITIKASEENFTSSNSSSQSGISLSSNLQEGRALDLSISKAGTKGMVAKEVTEDTLVAIRNNKNVITGEEGKKLAESIPMDRREYYEAITFEGRIMATVIGADAGMGVIYYKDPRTGEEQFGRIENIAVKYGVSTAIEGGGTIKSYSKPNTPIQDFAGYYGGIRGTIGYGLNVNYEFSVSNNEGKHGGGVGVGTGISFAGFFCKRKVIVLENLSEAEKEVIRTLVRYKGEIVDTYDFYYNLKKIKELMK